MGRRSRAFRKRKARVRNSGSRQFCGNPAPMENVRLHRSGFTSQKTPRTMDPRHPNTVALLCGPIVLFAVGESLPAVTRRQLLAATKAAKHSWRVELAAAPLTLLPFTAISDEPYSSYLLVS